MPPIESARWGVYAFGLGWLMDTCAGGTFSFDVNDAAWFQTLEQAMDGYRRTARPAFPHVVYPRMK